MDNFNEKNEFQESVNEIREQNRYGNDQGHYVGRVEPSRGMKNLYRKPSFIFFISGLCLIGPILNSVMNGFSISNIMENSIAIILGILCIVAGILRIKN